VNIEVINEENATVVDALVAGVRQHNVEHLGNEQSKPLTVVARDQNKKLIGGVSGRTIYKNFLINVVWVDKCARGTGLGRHLMELAETEAKNQGCLVAQVDTLAFQAPIFYEKLGFKTVGTIPAFEQSPERFYMMKQY
jgi:ribosomal protein S18 acetylase RimI-like enzyme